MTYAQMTGASILIPIVLGVIFALWMRDDEWPEALFAGCFVGFVIDVVVLGVGLLFGFIK